jgi:predicted ribosome quality control (RQC) complex YloA/Tae2 family protein
VQERQGHSSSKKQKSRKVAPLTDDDGNLIYIGRSGRENEQVTFDIAGSDDLWLHARGVPGSHVILRLRVPAAEPDETALETAAALAAWYSGSRESGSVEVDITQRRHVRKIKGSGPGMVTYRNERTVAVRPSAEDALRKAGRLE